MKKILLTAVALFLPLVTLAAPFGSNQLATTSLVAGNILQTDNTNSFWVTPGSLGLANFWSNLGINTTLNTGSNAVAGSFQSTSSVATNLFGFSAPTDASRYPGANTIISKGSVPFNFSGEFGESLASPGAMIEATTSGISAVGAVVIGSDTNTGFFSNVDGLVAIATSSGQGTNQTLVGAYVQSKATNTGGGNFGLISSAQNSSVENIGWFTEALGPGLTYVVNRDYDFYGNQGTMFQRNFAGFGTTTPWRQLSVNGSSDLGINALAGSFTATSSVASQLPYASTTETDAQTICFTSDTCRTSWPSNGSGTYPFTPSTNYSATNQATTGIAWFKNGMNASSTSNFELINVASTTGTSVFAGSASFGPNINMSASVGQIGASQIFGINSGSGLSSGGLFNSFSDVGSFSDGSLSTGTSGQCLKSTSTKTQWATCFSPFSTSTNPFMATYFVATSTIQASTFPYASTTAITTSGTSSTSIQFVSSLGGNSAGTFVAADKTGKLIATTSPSGGSGTVGSGLTGQIPFYNANGTTLTATSSIRIAQSGHSGANATDSRCQYQVYNGASSVGQPNDGPPIGVGIGCIVDPQQGNQGVIQVDYTNNGDNGGNIQPAAFNCYTDPITSTPCSQYLIFNNYSGTSTSSPVSAIAGAIFGIRPYIGGLIGGSNGVRDEMFGGGVGIFNAGTLESSAVNNYEGIGMMQDDGSGNITGTGTSFTGQIWVGSILCGDSFGECGTVTSVSDDTDLTIVPPMVDETFPDTFNIQNPYLNVSNGFSDYFKVGSDGNTYINSGNLGIGTGLTTPAQPLTVVGVTSLDNGSIFTDGSGSLTVGTLNGAGLSSCTGTGKALTWASGSFGCQSSIATSTGSWRNRTATTASVNTYTPTASSTYSIAVSASVKTISAGTLTITCTYTNTDGISSTATFFPMGLTTAGLSGTGSPALSPLTITPMKNLPVTVVATFTGVSIAYDIDASILPIGSLTK